MTATLSKCRKYRYELSRDVDMFADKVYAYFGINPSTADETVDDATVKRWIGFTQKFNGKCFLVGNAFAFRATSVSELASSIDPIGPENNHHLLSIIEKADILVPCWGNRDKIPKRLHGRLEKVMGLLKASGKPVKAFGFTASGDPKHPLMLPYKTNLIDLM